MAQGLANAPIGERLRISQRAAEPHRSSLLRKLGPATQTDLFRYAAEHSHLADAD